MRYSTFFSDVTRPSDVAARPPFPYQERLATRSDGWPTLLDVPTGLGKTAAAVVAWLWRRLEGDPETGRRLVFTLPTRVLVDQTREAVEGWCERARPFFADRGRPPPTVHVLRGGDLDESWQADPCRERVLIGTQDMMLSRALNRGFAMSRSRWPMHFAFVNDDCLWVLDETQLMGVGVETSAQLQAFRALLHTFGPARTLWMSATLGTRQLDTVDHPQPEGGWRAHTISDEDRAHPHVSKRLSAAKSVRLDGPALEGGGKKDEETYVQALAEEVADAHRQRGGLTLAILNSVRRAQLLAAELRKGKVPVSLIHSRFRAGDRSAQEAALQAEGDRVIVATQAIEAGVDVSARTLFSELAPWPSLVQRLGRCNRYGEESDALFVCATLAVDSDDKLALPYRADELRRARELLETLAGAADLRSIAKASESYEPPPVVRPVVRRRDLLQLFDTTPDLMGNDIDVSRYIRDDADTDVHLYWRELDGMPAQDEPRPHRDEICAVGIGAANDFLEKVWKKRSGVKSTRGGLGAWTWDPVSGRWTAARTARPGQLLLLSTTAGGYDAAMGFTGEIRHGPVSRAEPPAAEPSIAEEGEPELREAEDDQLDADPLSAVGVDGVWVPLADHLGHVEQEARELAGRLDLAASAETLGLAGRWHDVGKAHEEFQRRLIEPVGDDPAQSPPSADVVWAKSAHQLRATPNLKRPVFRHELASALAWLGANPDHPESNLIAYLIAAHHGKVRLGLRSAPTEAGPGDGRAFALGVWDGDQLLGLELHSGETIGAEPLRLDLLALGEGSWRERSIALLQEHGPFRLAMLETLVRVADWTASRKEQERGYDA